jgi:hypothetical protein
MRRKLEGGLINFIEKKILHFLLRKYEKKIDDDYSDTTSHKIDCIRYLLETIEERNTQ